MMALSLLRTRVARRILALFLVCAMLPVVTFAAVGYAVVARSLEADAREQLRQGSKAAGMVLYDRLQVLSSELTRQSMMTGANNGSSVFRGVLGEDVSGRIKVIQGQPFAIPRLSSRQMAHLAQGLPVLITVTDSAPATLILGLMNPVPHVELTRVWATTSVEALLGQEEGQSPALPGTKLCLLDGEGRPVSCPDTEAALVAAGRGTRPDEPLQWKRGDSLFLMGRWDLFLGNGFESAAWTVALSMPSTAVLAPLNTFRRVSLLSVALAGLLVFLLSHAQLRKRMTPLAELESGVRRISSGDFSVPVSIRSADEFEVLANSFNGMARDLQRQFSTLKALHVVDLAALEVRSAEAIADATLTCAPELLDSDHASVAFADLEDSSRWIELAGSRAEGLRTRTIIQIGPDELRELADHPQHLRIGAGGRTRQYAALRRLDRSRERLVFPIRCNAKIRAVLAVGRTDGTPFGDGVIALGRQLADQLALGLSNVVLLSELSALSEGSMLALARTIDANSNWTAGHSERVTRGALEIGRRLQLDPASLDRIRRGGMLHDIGKIGVPATILNKPGPLTDAERIVVQSHTTTGAGIIEPISALQDIIPLVRSHHELMDGSGYPDGLHGEAIPEIVRILTVADIYDALISDRPYRPGLAQHAALNLLRDGAGRRFDARAVHALAAALDEGWSSMVFERRLSSPPVAPIQLEVAV